MTAEALGNQILSYLDTHWSTELDVVDRSVLAAGIALHLAGAGGVSPTAPDERERLAYLITAKRFHERGIQSPITDEDIEVARPMADFLIAEGLGFRRSREATTEPRPITDADVEIARSAFAKAEYERRYAADVRVPMRAALEAVEASRSPKPTEQREREPVMGIIYAPEPKHQPIRPSVSPTEYPPGSMWESEDGTRWVIEWDNQDHRYWWFQTDQPVPSSTDGSLGVSREDGT